MAAGEEKRWGNHMGIPKQLVPVFGERLIDRTIRQLRELEAHVWVTVPSKGFYGHLGYTVGQITGRHREYELGKFINADNVFKDNQPILLLWGDTFFTDEAMDTIFDEYDQHEFRFFGRETPGEIFACKANWQVMEKVRTLYTLRKCMSSLGSWHLYRLINDIPLEVQKVTDHFTEINDLTEDFDFPEDYKQWLARGGSAE